MKTTFTLDKENVKLARQMESTKSTINKYIKRERKKKLPEGVDFWDFDCKFGETKEDATPVHLAELTKALDAAEQKGLISFYVEIVVKEGSRTRKPKS